MGQQVQQSQIANYRRRMQREAPAARMKTLFEQNDILRQTYTVTISEGFKMKSGDCVHAVVNSDAAGSHFSVIDTEGRRIGCIVGESSRVLAETLQKNELDVVCLTITGLIPITGDARVQIRPE